MRPARSVVTGVPWAPSDRGTSSRLIASYSGLNYSVDWSQTRKQLLVTLSKEISRHLGARAIIGGVPLTRIGSVTAGRGVLIRSGDRERSLTASGFRHF